MTIVPAAPLDGPALLPNPLIAQYVKPEGDEQLFLLQALRLTALGWVESHTGHSLQRRSWVAMFDGFTPALRLPRQPLHAVTALGYVARGGAVVDGAGAWQVVGNHLLPLSGHWPATAAWPGAVTVTFEAGYDNLGAQEPALQIAALMMVKHLFDGGSLDDVPATVSLLLDAQYRTPVIG